MSPAIVKALAARRIEPGTAVIRIDRGEVGHVARDAKKGRGQALSDGDMARLPEMWVTVEMCA